MNKEQEAPQVSCTQEEFDEQVLGAVRGDLPANRVIEELANFYKVLSDFTRMRILLALTDKELCVYHISESLEMTQSAISHQLRVLRENHLVKARREGKQMFYSLDDNHVGLIIKQGLEHIVEPHEIREALDAEEE